MQETSKLIPKTPEEKLNPRSKHISDHPAQNRYSSDTTSTKRWRIPRGKIINSRKSMGIQLLDTLRMSGL